MSLQLLERFKAVRAHSERLCSPLEIEDYVVQPAAFVSPPKWHLAHCTWFFEELVLKQFVPGYHRFDPAYRKLFNSYYKAAGEHWLQAERGQLSRPTVAEIYRYRSYVDQCVEAFLAQSDVGFEALELIEIGLQHEQQHQELLLMDIKYILAANPTLPAYQSLAKHDAQKVEMPAPEHAWLNVTEGLVWLGAEPSKCLHERFVYDNECSRHQVYLQSFSLRNQAVSNAEYLEFINAGGYQEPSHWLSQGWDWVQQDNICAPLYWQQKDGAWYEYTLYGLDTLIANAPVCHISYFEADAFARWAGYRLPSEVELELAYQLSEPSKVSSAHITPPLHPNDCSALTGQTWAWTNSHYSAYPGFKTFDGMLREYNGKFMCGQFVLRGGCIATPAGHFRPSYRNFYLPEQRWMFSGLRLAKEV